MFIKSLSKRTVLVIFMVLFGIFSVSGNVFADIFTANGQVKDGNGNSLPGTGVDDRASADPNSLFGVVQLINAGKDGIIDPPDADGNPTGDDVLLVANSGLDFAVVGEGFPNFPEFGITPDGKFSDKFQYTVSLADQPKFYCRAWDKTFPKTSAHYGDSELYTLVNATFDSHDFGIFSTDISVSKQTWYMDGDNDNYGDPENSVESSTQPVGFVADNTDCNDDDDTVYPEAPELCDGKDNDCNGQIDDGANCPTWYRDFDNDGYGNPDDVVRLNTQPDGYVGNDRDCNDDDNTVYPGAPELCDGKDNNCNGQIDEGANCTIWYMDGDSDNYGDPENSMESFTQPDGFVADNTDCDDTDGSVNPGAAEICDGKDNNCNGQIDEGADCTIWYRDSDSDDYGDPDNSMESFTQPVGFVADNTDCDDTDSSVNPGAAEICDGKDNNCNGQIDEGADCTIWYRDGDSDDYGDPDNSMEFFTQPDGFVADNTDCDDTDGSVNPDADEIPYNGKDDDCDPGTPDITPEIEVLPLINDFGDVAVGASLKKIIIITNIGPEVFGTNITGYLTITDILPGDGSSPEFEIAVPVSLPAILGPGENIEVCITYIPLDEGSDEGTVRILSDDADEDVVTVLCEGNGIFAPICQVSDLSARSKSGRVQLVWNHLGADSYNVYRKTAGGEFSMLANTTSIYSTYLDEDVVNGTTYHYIVKCVCDGFECEASNEVSVTSNEIRRRR